MNEFSRLPLTASMIENLDTLGYKSMTPIQAKAIPHVLKGEDLLAQAKTGSGKTAAFGIGFLQNLDVKLFRVQALVMCPTRELADQVAIELRRIARFKHNIKILTLSGGVPIRFQEASLEHQAHIIVGTPGRIEQHLQNKNLNLDHLKTLVLDEADRMLDIGFHDSIVSILSHAPEDRQTLLFSATFPEAIKNISGKFQKDAQEIVVDSKHEENVIHQHFYEVAWEAKFETVAAILNTAKPESTLVFCNTKKDCRSVARYLSNKGFHALAIHGDLEQKDRTEVLARFTNRSSTILIATDVAARGIDISDLAAVINFDFPFESEVYVHRVGRTGRAGKEGQAYSLVTPKEQHRLEDLNGFMQTDFKAADTSSLDKTDTALVLPPMVTLSINGGRKSKIRPGDILGALTKGDEIKGKQVGKINCFDLYSYVAVERNISKKAEETLSSNKIKGRYFIIKKHL